MNTTTLEPLEEILATAQAAAGFIPSDKQRKDWRRAGLLPRPVVQRGKGREHGSMTLYPPRTGKLLTAICRHSRPKKPMPELAFLVWWDGYTLPDMSLIHVALNQTLDEWERLTAPWARLDAVSEDAWKTLDTQLQKRLPPPLRAIAKRGDTWMFRPLAATLLNIAAGGFDGFQSYRVKDDVNVSAEEVLEDSQAPLAFDQATWIPDNWTEQLVELSATLKPAILRGVLYDATDEDLSLARDEVRDMVKLIDDISHLARRFTNNEELEPFEHLDSRLLTPGILAGFLLFWLSASRQPKLRNRYRQLAPAFATMSVMRHLLNTTSPEETKRPPRRRQPSEGATHGERPSTCTTSLASPSPPPDPDMEFLP